MNPPTLDLLQAIEKDMSPVEKLKDLSTSGVALPWVGGIIVGTMAVGIGFGSTMTSLTSVESAVESIEHRLIRMEGDIGDNSKSISENRVLLLRLLDEKPEGSGG